MVTKQPATNCYQNPTEFLSTESVASQLAWCLLLATVQWQNISYQQSTLTDSS